MTNKENILRTIHRNNPEWIPYRYDSLTNLLPDISTRPEKGGRDDWGIQTTRLLSPDQWRKYIKPRIKILYDIVKKYDRLVFQHSFGHIEDIIHDLIEMGCDVFDPCQPAANDIFKWKREYGNDLNFMGGLDTQTYLSLGTPEEVKREVKNVLSIMGKGGGYIPAPSHTINLPKANVKAMTDAIYEVNGTF